MVLGSRELTPEQARTAAKEVLANVALGKDPATSRQRERDMSTFREFAQRYLSEEAALKLKPGTVKNYEICVRKHAAPTLGSIKLDAVSTADISRLHLRIGQAKPMTANRVVECISSIYRYAAICNVVPYGHNPTNGIRAFREHRRERFLSSAELAKLGEAIREGETEGIPYIVDETKPTSKHAPKPENRRTLIDQFAAAAVRLLLLTGARLREILDLKWDYVDLERGLLFLPDSKTGRKTIVLNAPAMGILAGLPRMSCFVIAGEQQNKPRVDLNRPWRAIVRRAGLQGLRIHDLRHTHASFGAGAGLGLPIIGKLLGHTQASTTQRYAHLDADPLRRASEQIASQIATAMGERKQG
jgi:integrase